MSDNIPRDWWLRAICEKPHDDAVRLAYCDWLEEPAQNEPERAEFIRVQIELAAYGEKCGRTGKVPWCSAPECRGCSLRARERELLTQYGQQWTGAILNVDSNKCYWPNARPNMTGVPGVTFTWSRGFISSISLTSETLWGVVCGRCMGSEYHSRTETMLKCRHCSGTGRTPGIGEKLFELNPITEVRVTDKEPHSVLSFWWNIGSDTYHNIPNEIFALLAGFTKRWVARSNESDGKAYPTPAAANAALSLAVVNHYRKENGYPELGDTKPGR